MIKIKQFYILTFGTRRVPCPCFFLAIFANLSALLFGLQPFYKIEKSTAAAFPEVIALANLATPHDCAV